MALSALLAALRNSGTDKEQREKKAKDLSLFCVSFPSFPFLFQTSENERDTQVKERMHLCCY